MSAPFPTDATVKHEEPGPDPGLCLICTLPVREQSGEIDALLCNQCGVAYHRECAPDWTSECYQCLCKDAVSRFRRSLPPPAVEVEELDGDGDEEEPGVEEEEEEDEDEEEESPRSVLGPAILGFRV